MHIFNEFFLDRLEIRILDYILLMFLGQPGFDLGHPSLRASSAKDSITILSQLHTYFWHLS